MNKLINDVKIEGQCIGMVDIFNDLLQVFPYPIEISMFDQYGKDIEIKFLHVSHSKFFFQLSVDFLSAFDLVDLVPDFKGLSKSLYIEYRNKIIG